MKSGTHHIKSKVFEISFNDEKESLRFQKNFSEFIRNELVEITEKCLSAFDGPALKIINRLELDLGDISYEAYEKTLITRYEEALTNALFNKLEFEGPDKEEQEDSPTSIIYMIRHFLLKGYMPWNYDESSWESFNQMFEHASSINMDLLVEELNELLSSSPSRTRLILQLEEGAIKDFVRHIEPSQSTLIVDYHKNWMQAEKKQRFFGETSNQLSKSFWLFIFNYLYEERGSYFNTKSFLISTLRQIANQFNLSFKEVMNQLRVVHKLVANTRFNDFYYLLEEILTMEEVEFDKAQEDAQIDSEVVGMGFSDIIFYVEHGRWPEQINESISFASAFSDLQNRESKKLKDFIVEAATNASKIHRIIALLGDAHIGSLFLLLAPYSSQELLAYHEFFKTLKNGVIEEFKEIDMTAVMVASLSGMRGSSFNHSQFLNAILTRLSNQSAKKYKPTLKRIEEALCADKSKFKHSNSGKFLVQFLADESGNKTKKNTRLFSEEIDMIWIEESIISSEIHPLLVKVGYLSIRDVLMFLAQDKPKILHQFVKKRLTIKRFNKGLMRLVDPEFFDLLQPTFAASHHDWRRIWHSIDHVTASHSLHRDNLEKALKTMIFQLMYGLFVLDSKNIEKQLIELSKAYDLDFNLFVRSILQLTEYSKDQKLNDRISSIATLLGIQYYGDEHLSLKLNPVQRTIEDKRLDKLLVLVVSAINGRVNEEELALLGFRSADEVLRHLMKIHPHLLKVKLASLHSWNQSFLGIGREIPMSTFYALLAFLDGVVGKQVTILLRKLEIELNEGSQSMNRFLNISRSLALFSLAQQSFNVGEFIKNFVQLIRDSSPVIYSQVIPVLSKNISTISLPTHGNTDKIINDLEAQLSQLNPNNLPMDAHVLSNLINDEFFGQALETEATIIPYFDETADVVYDEIYIENAGLVILSSYFSVLFERMSLLKDGKFLSQQKQEMAVLLLQHLMLDKPPLNEHHLPLNKVLCGLDVPHPIHTDIQISSKDRKIIHGLIEAVIGYWTAIGHSSIEGFQGSWLWRKGKLENKEECWELKVEQNSYDMLLDRLPFTLSPIKFSWMEKPLIVEWR